MSPSPALVLSLTHFLVLYCDVGHDLGKVPGPHSGPGHGSDTVAHLEGHDGDAYSVEVEGSKGSSKDDKDHGKLHHDKDGALKPLKDTSKHLLHAKKWGRDPQLCEEFFTEGAGGRCPDRDTCCGLLNATDKYFHIDIYCCHDTEKCCQGRCCSDQTVCCHEKDHNQVRYGNCCDKNRGCCTDLRGNAVCCQTMLGRYWWVIAVILTVYLASKTTMLIRRYRAMPDVGKDRLRDDKQLSVKIKNMTYCC